jgi:hypothetical protein
LRVIHRVVELLFALLRGLGVDTVQIVSHLAIERPVGLELRRQVLSWNQLRLFEVHLSDQEVFPAFPRVDH